MYYKGQIFYYIDNKNAAIRKIEVFAWDEAYLYVRTRDGKKWKILKSKEGIDWFETHRKAYTYKQENISGNKQSQKPNSAKRGTKRSAKRSKKRSSKSYNNPYWNKVVQYNLYDVKRRPNRYKTSTPFSYLDHYNNDRIKENNTSESDFRRSPNQDKGSKFYGQGEGTPQMGYRRFYR